jgi:hypothetical protein
MKNNTNSIFYEPILKLPEADIPLKGVKLIRKNPVITNKAATYLILDEGSRRKP